MSAVLFSEVVEWLRSARVVESAVLFGSQAAANTELPPNSPSDIDLHIISAQPHELERVDWRAALPRSAFLFQAVRPATGGVRKVTVGFAAGQIDLVVVSHMYATIGNIILRTKIHRRLPAARVALNEMATCLRSGYRFLKGEAKWGRFYADVAQNMPGVRLEDAEACLLADAFVADLMWVRQKANAGEFVAAQHVLHRNMSETNLRLYRELQLRRNASLRSFGLGRRVEGLASRAELDFLRISASPERTALLAAGEKCFAGLKILMAEISPAWVAPQLVESSLDVRSEK
jgi:hypothetical protein